MWFGDLVTMKWWNDLWLNESFAEWASTIATAEATEWTEAWTTFNSMEKSWAYRQDQLPSTHPIVAEIRDLEDVLVNFDGITYAKGGSVLKQLAAWVGIDAFFAGVSAYFKKHALGQHDPRRPARRARGRERPRPRRAWSKLWLETAGVNTLRPEIATDDAGAITAFAVLQSAHRRLPDDPPAPRSRSASTTSSTATLVRDHRVELDVDGERTDVAELVGLARPDLVLLNDDDLAYAKIRLDEASHAASRSATCRRSRTRSPAPSSGARCGTPTRDAETRASDYLDLVLGNIASETESTTLRIIARERCSSPRARTSPPSTAPTHAGARRRLLAARAAGRGRAATPSSSS